MVKTVLSLISTGHDPFFFSNFLKPVYPYDPGFLFGQGHALLLFSFGKNFDFATVALSFVCGKYYLIID